MISETFNELNEKNKQRSIDWLINSIIGILNEDKVFYEMLKFYEELHYHKDDYHKNEHELEVFMEGLLNEQ